MMTMADKVNLPGGEFVSESNKNFERKLRRGEIAPEVKFAVEASRRGAEKNNTEEKAEKALAEAGLSTEIRAKFKIEISFGKGRTTAGPNLAGIQLWESGKKLHGGGDELMFWCQTVDPNRQEGCWSPIPGVNVGLNRQTGEDVAVCPKCFRKWHPSKITTMRIFRLPSKALAEIIEKMFRDLGSNADIYCKYHATDIRYQAMLHAKGLETARKLKGMHMYRLHRILKDTSAGAALDKRIVAFLSS